jgi:hypothetical protein
VTPEAHNFDQRSPGYARKRLPRLMRITVRPSRAWGRPRSGSKRIFIRAIVFAITLALTIFPSVPSQAPATLRNLLVANSSNRDLSHRARATHLGIKSPIAATIRLHFQSAAPDPMNHNRSETTGARTRTFTNYRNAGGHRGKSIRSNMTERVSCRIRGFKVQDGDSWWYRVASRPWRGRYYASADAFYNNGQTTGSLKHTPFVDRKVRKC